MCLCIKNNLNGIDAFKLSHCFLRKHWILSVEDDPDLSRFDPESPFKSKNNASGSGRGLAWLLLIIHTHFAQNKHLESQFFYILLYLSLGISDMSLLWKSFTTALTHCIYLERESASDNKWAKSEIREWAFPAWCKSGMPVRSFLDLCKD